MAAGQTVSQGDEVLIVRGDEDELPMVAPRSGKVLSVAVKAGDAVEAGQVLATIA